MKIIISKTQFEKLISEQTAFEFQLDRTYSDPKKAEEYNKQLKQISSSTNLDDLVDIVSAIIDGVPGIGNLVSAGIDLTHSLAYFVRAYFSTNDDEKCELITLGIITLGVTLIPVGGNSLPIMVRQGFKTFSKKTPQEILILAKELGIYNKTVIFLSKTKWKYNILLVLAKIVGSKLSELLTSVTKILSQLYKNIKQDNVRNAINLILSFINELSQFTDVALKISKNIDSEITKIGSKRT